MHVIVHIGPYKTGTSAIQKALRDHADTLRQRGVLHFFSRPKPPRTLSALFDSSRSLTAPDLARYFATPDEARAWSARCWEKFEAEAAAPDVKLSVISSEFFFDIRDHAGFLARLKGRFSRITVVSYVRDPVELYLSGLQQAIKGGRCLRDLNTPSGYGYSYGKFLPRFVEAVGIENMIVRRFSRDALDGGDVVIDFFNRLQAFGPVPGIAPVRVNESLPGAVLAWLLLANETWDRKVSGPARREVLRKLRSAPEIAALPKLRLENRLFEQAIRARTRADCVWLNETFLQGQPPLPVSDAADPGADEAQLRADMRDWLLEYLTPQAQHAIARIVTA